MTDQIEAPVKRSYSEAKKVQVFDGEFMPHVDSMYNFAYRLTFR